MPGWSGRPAREAGSKRRLVLVGNGMAGLKVLEELLAVAPELYEITVFGAEPHAAYNRVLLSSLLAGESDADALTLRDRAWYHAHGIELRCDDPVIEIDRALRLVRSASGHVAPYDRLVLCTGSVPFVPEVPGVDLPGVTSFRDLADVDHMLQVASLHRRAVVVGGGVLGLEAAHGLLKRGMDVTVVHLPAHLMERQLDVGAADRLRASLEARGLRFQMEKRTAGFFGERWVEGVRFDDGSTLPTDLVVLACGIRPRVALMQAAGLRCARGVVVGDTMQTWDPRVYAVGECAEHRGRTYGLVAPIYDQAKVCANHLAEDGYFRYAGTLASTRLKVSGIDVFSAGQLSPEAGVEDVVFEDPARSIYRRVLLRGNTLVGVVLYGDTSDAGFYLDRLRSGVDVSAERELLVFGATFAAEVAAVTEPEANPEPVAPLAQSAATDRPPTSVPAPGVLAALDTTARVCACHDVSKGAIEDAIADGARDLEAIRRCTGASRSCGSCRPTILRLLRPDAPSEARDPLCACTDLDHDSVRESIVRLSLRRLEDVFSRLSWRSPDGCVRCRPAVNYYLLCAWPELYRDDAFSRPASERLHANIQRDGTYSVVPRIFGGMTTPDQLRAIADAAETFGVRAIKITGGQRIDLLGVEKEMLPGIWRALGEAGFVSGHAYAKSVRTVKTCVGTEWCRFGVRDSTAIGIELEEMCWGAATPHKVKMGVSGCHRNCAESTIKDFGVVAHEDAFELFVGGNGGMRVRAADLLCRVPTELDVVEHCGAYLQLYREEARYSERSAGFVERVGVGYLRERLVDDPVGRGLLFERFHRAQRTSQRDPWAERAADASDFVPLSRLAGGRES